MLPPFVNAYEDFPYLKYFSPLTREEYEEAYEAVVAMWSGVFDLWQTLPAPVAFRKRGTVAALLIAWYLTDMYPERLQQGMQGGAGGVVAAKALRSVSITFRDPALPDAYFALKSNQFGIKAAYLIHSAPEMIRIF